jgi:hypothetical protein
MWLDAKSRCWLVRYEPNHSVIAWTVDVKAMSSDGTNEFTVGRLLADELRPYEIEEWGENVSDVADADSGGLIGAWSAITDEKGAIRDDVDTETASSVVYLYRFALHHDFSEWRMAVMDSFCRTFGDSAIIMAQYNTTLFSRTEFEQLNFDPLAPLHFKGKSPSPRSGGARSGVPPSAPDEEIEFMTRNNAYKAKFLPADYPKEADYGNEKHQEWIEKNGPWSDLI